MKTKQTRGSIYLETDMSLEYIIKQLKDVGVTDFSKVTYNHNYVSNRCSCEDYCYCESGYNDIRLDWEI